MPAVASAATSVVIAHVAGGTSTIRVGAGGIMLPNHSPLVIAEQFGTLESLFPGRIDLGVGPGARQRSGDGDGAAPAPQRRLVPAGRPGAHRAPARARAGATGQGGSWRGAAGADLDPGIEPVRRAARGRARPAVRVRVALRAGADDVGDRDLPQPFPAVGAHEGAARTPVPDARRQRRRGRHAIRRRGGCSPRTSRSSSRYAAARSAPCRRRSIPIASRQRSRRSSARSCNRCCRQRSSARPTTVERGLSDFLDRTGADELIIAAQIFDHAARLRSYEIVAETRQSVVGSRQSSVTVDSPQSLVAVDSRVDVD